MAVTTQLVGKLGGGLDWEPWGYDNFRALGPIMLKVTSENRVYLTVRTRIGAASESVRGTEYFPLRKDESVSGLQGAQTVEYLKVE